MPYAICLGGVTIQPGERRTIDVPVARLQTHADMTMPVQVVRGRKPGPCLFVSAAMHGDEINGVEVIYRLLQRISRRRLRGTVIAVPVVNVYGFINQSRYLPDRRDLNRFFPGSDKGSLTSRLARLFMQEIVAHCTHGIDIHTGSHHRTNLPQIRAGMDDPETARLARAFGAPVIVDAALRDGSLRQAVAARGLPMLLYEAGEALRFDEVAIRVGVTGILSVMQAIDMLPASRSRKAPFEPLVARSSTWVRAPMSGILRTRTPLGRQVAAHTMLGSIGDPFGENEVDITAAAAGLVIGRLNLPLVYRGDALFHIACFDRSSAIDAALEAFEHDPELHADFEPFDRLNSL